MMTRQLNTLEDYHVQVVNVSNVHPVCRVHDLSFGVIVSYTFNLSLLEYDFSVQTHLDFTREFASNNIIITIILW